MLQTLGGFRRIRRAQMLSVPPEKPIEQKLPDRPRYRLLHGMKALRTRGRGRPDAIRTEQFVYAVLDRCGIPIEVPERSGYPSDWPFAHARRLHADARPIASPLPGSAEGREAAASGRNPECALVLARRQVALLL